MWEWRSCSNERIERNQSGFEVQDVVTCNTSPTTDSDDDDSVYYAEASFVSYLMVKHWHRQVYKLELSSRIDVTS